MLFPTLARILSRGAKQTRRLQAKPRLAIESLEDRAVPANNLTIVAGDVDTNIDQPNGNGAIREFKTTGGDAQLSIETLQDVLKDSNVHTVIVSTEPRNPPADDDEEGNILWDATIAGSLNFEDFGSGKKLIFRTVAGSGFTEGTITLTAVQFSNTGSNDQISLEFDTSATGGDITFQTNNVDSDTVTFSAEAVKDLTINAGTGSFSFTNILGNATTADVGGSISITANDVVISHESGLTAFGEVLINAEGSVFLDDDTGLLASEDLTIAAPFGAVTASNGGITSETGKVAITGTDVSLTAMFMTAPAGLSINGETSITLDGGTYDIDGDVSLISTGSVSVIGIALPDPGLLFDQTVEDVVIVGDDVTLESTTIHSIGTLSITGTTINLTGSTLTSEGNLIVTGPVRMKGDIDVFSNGNIVFSDEVDGTFGETTDLDLSAAGILSFGGHIGPVNALDSLSLFEGSMSLGSHSLNAATVNVGLASNPIEATLGLDGTLTGNVNVLATGNLSPGGLLAVGIMTVTGNVHFTGDFALDFAAPGAPGPQSDLLIVGGDVVIGSSSKLGAGLGTGALAAPNVTILDYGGSLTGQFENANVNVPVLVGTDAIRVSSYGNGSDDAVVVSPVTGQGTTVFGIEPDPLDPTGFKAVLTGGGTLVTGKDWTGSLFLVARGTGPLSKLTITTIANGSNDIVTFPAGILISGPLVSFLAPKVNIGTQFRSNDRVNLATFRDFEGTFGNFGIQFGGQSGQRTTINARNIFGSVRVSTTLTSLKVTQALGAQVNIPHLEDSVVAAPIIGKVSARSATTNIASSMQIAAVAITGDYFGDITAGSLGTFTAGSMEGAIQTSGAITSIKTTRTFRGSVEAASISRFIDVGSDPLSGNGSEATLRITGAIGSILGKGEGGLVLEVDASAIGTINVQGELSGDGVIDEPDINVAGRIGALTAGAIYDMELQAKFLGAVAINGSLNFGISGDVANSTFTVTGNDGLITENAIRSFVAKGNVRDSRFDIRGGNVPVFTVGRFHHSQLYMNYVPDAGGDFTQGQFGAFGQRHFRLGAFRTTAVPPIETVPSNHPMHWAFKGSEIVANTIGSVTLSGLQTENASTGFGIKVRAATIVKVLKADNSTAVSTTTLQPDKNLPYEPIANDFFYIVV